MQLLATTIWMVAMADVEYGQCRAITSKGNCQCEAYEQERVDALWKVCSCSHTDAVHKVPPKKGRKKK